MEQPEEFKHLEGVSEIEVSEHVVMIIAEGTVTFEDMKTGMSVSMSEWELGEADVTYLMLRLEQKYPSMKTGFDNTADKE